MKRASIAGLFALLAAAGFVLAEKESQFGVPVQIVPGVWFAVDFLERLRTKPFVLYLPHKAVHPEATQNGEVCRSCS